MTEKKAHNTGNEGGGWSAILLQGIFGSIQTLVADTLENLKHGTEMFARTLAKRIILFILFVWSLLFMLVGVARILDGIYAWPGMGEVVVGASIFLVTLLLYVFHRNEN